MLLVVTDGRMLNKIASIFTGWILTFLFWDSPKAKHRRKICKACEFLTWKYFLWIIPIPVCGKCKCPIIPKSKSNREFCPVKKW